MTVLEFETPSKESLLSRAISNPSNNHLHEAIQFACGNAESLNEADLPALMNRQVIIAESNEPPRSVSAHVRRGQSRAQTKLTECIVRIHPLILCPYSNSLTNSEGNVKGCAMNLIDTGSHEN